MGSNHKQQMAPVTIAHVFYFLGMVGRATMGAALAQPSLMVDKYQHARTAGRYIRPVHSSVANRPPVNLNSWNCVEKSSTDPSGTGRAPLDTCVSTCAEMA